MSITGTRLKSVFLAVASPGNRLGWTTLLLLAVLAPIVPGLWNMQNLLGLAGYLLPVLALAIGLTSVMIIGGIDLSMTSIVALTSVVGAQILTCTNAGSNQVALGLLAMIIAGGVVGILNGVVISLSGMPSFIVTLASMMFWSGFSIWWTQSRAIYGLPQSFLEVGQHLSISLTIVCVLVLLVHFFLARTRFGRWIYAVGQNSKTARISGVPVRSVTISVYAFSGVCAAIGSILLTSRLETGSPVMGRELLLDVIGATVIGGTSLSGGKGKIAGTVMGVLFLALVDNVLNLLNCTSFLIMIAKGSVILAASVLDGQSRGQRKLLR